MSSCIPINADFYPVEFDRVTVESACYENYLQRHKVDQEFSMCKICTYCVTNNTYLKLSEGRARRKIPMTMEDWAKRLDKFLEFDEREILQHSGKVTAEIARDHAESEFEKYRIVQDRLFESDFDRVVEEIGRKKPEGDQ